MLFRSDLSDVHSAVSGIFRPKAHVGEDVRYKDLLAEVVDPYEGHVKEQILAPTDGIVFFGKNKPLVSEGEIVYRLIHRLHE